MAIQLLGAGITEVGEAGGSSGDGSLDVLTGGVRVSEADFEAQADGVLDGFDGAGSFRGERDQDRGFLCDGLYLFQGGRGGIRHVMWRVSAMEAGLIGQEGAFDVPAGDHAGGEG